MDENIKGTFGQATAWARPLKGTGIGLGAERQGSVLLFRVAVRAADRPLSCLLHSTSSEFKVKVTSPQNAGGSHLAKLRALRFPARGIVTTYCRVILALAADAATIMLAVDQVWT